MKATTAVCATGAVPPISSGRIQRARSGENAEIQMYLTKLQDLVPFMPKNRKISKLEVIQHVIDYICELQTALESHPEAGSFDAAAVLGSQIGAAPAPAPSPRRPLTPANSLLQNTSAPQSHPHTVSLIFDSNKNLTQAYWCSLITPYYLEISPHRILSEEMHLKCYRNIPLQII